MTKQNQRVKKDSLQSLSIASVVLLERNKIPLRSAGIDKWLLVFSFPQDKEIKSKNLLGQRLKRVKRKANFFFEIACSLKRY